MVAGVGFEPHDLRVMSPTSYQTAPSRDILVPEAGVEPVRESFSRDFKSRASANSAIPAFCDLLVPHCLYIIALFVPNVNTFFHFFEIFRFLYWHAPQNVVSYISGFRGGCVLSYAARRRFMHRLSCKNAFSAKCLTKLNTWIIAQFCIVIGIFRLCRRYPHLPLTSELDASAWGVRSGFVKRVSRATSK